MEIRKYIYMSNWKMLNLCLCSWKVFIGKFRMKISILDLKKVKIELIIFYNKLDKVK